MANLVICKDADKKYYVRVLARNYTSEYVKTFNIWHNKFIAEPFDSAAMAFEWTIEKEKEIKGVIGGESGQN